jgi:hypothetical protein
MKQTHSVNDIAHGNSTKKRDLAVPLLLQSQHESFSEDGEEFNNVTSTEANDSLLNRDLLLIVS